MTESNLIKKIKVVLKNKYGWEGWKIHGHALQEKGIPDILCIISPQGILFGIEAKIYPNKPSQIQIYQLKLIRSLGGKGIVVNDRTFNLFKQIIEEGELNEFDKLIWLSSTSNWEINLSSS